MFFSCEEIKGRKPGLWRFVSRWYLQRNTPGQRGLLGAVFRIDLAYLSPFLSVWSLGAQVKKEPCPCRGRCGSIGHD